MYNICVMLPVPPVQCTALVQEMALELFALQGYAFSAVSWSVG
jgi:hypothetical protein